MKQTSDDRTSVLMMAAAGLSPERIAAALGVSLARVRLMLEQSLQQAPDDDDGPEAA